MPDRSDSPDPTDRLPLHELPKVAGDAAGAAMFADTLLPSDAGHYSPGDEVGPYTLVEKLGDGGFGSVWQASQTEPVRRQVALKIIKLGMDTLEVMARFEQERRALALMEHPNIAKVLDAGATPEGRPFFVMELVRGPPLTQYCIEKRLPLEARLLLFKDVCSGVQHAHQKGVIHRDLKPSNILVAEVDGVPVPKIIDFGIAKATTTDKLTALTLVTRREQMIGTPLYMSPEQAAASGDIDTRTDVYALGALLYELLAARPPFDARTLMAAGYDEMRRIIREQEPVPPSKRRNDEGRMTHGESKAFTGKGSGTRHSSLVIRPSADLDLITLRALEKDRTRRYESATALGEDIQRFLNHEPVMARAPSLGYLAQRWVRRHRATAVAASVCLLAILGGAGVALWQAHVARQHEREARRQLADADAATQVVLDTLGPLHSYGAARMIDRQQLVRDLARQIEAYSGDPMRKASLLAKLSAATANVPDQIKLQRSAVALAEQGLGNDDRRLWDMRFSLAQSLSLMKATRAEGIAQMRLVLDWMRGHLGTEHSYAVFVAANLGWYLDIAGQPEEAAPFLAEANRLAVLNPKSFTAGHRAFFRTAYARSLFDLGKRDEALALGRDNNRTALAELGPASFDAARSTLVHAQLCQKAGLLDEAAATAHQAFESFVNSVGPVGLYPGRCLDLLLKIEQERGDIEALLATHRNLVHIFDSKLGPAHPATAKRVVDYAKALSTTGRSAEADELCTDWLKRHSLSDSDLAPEAEDILRAHIQLLGKKPDLPREEQELQSLVALVEKARPQDLKRYGDMSDLAYVLIQQHKNAEALPLLREVVNVLEARGSENKKVTKACLKKTKRWLAELGGAKPNGEQAAGTSH